MELFLNTVGEQFNIAIIDNKKVVTFQTIITDRNTASNGVYWIEKFLKKHKLDLKEITGYYITIGPGSFTGTKVGLNIIKSFELVHPTNNFKYIDNFELLRRPAYKSVAIKISKDKYATRTWMLNLHFDKIIKSSLIKRNTVIGYDKFNIDQLQSKVSSKKFKLCNNLDNINLFYVNKII